MGAHVDLKRNAIYVVSLPVRSWLDTIYQFSQGVRTRKWIANGTNCSFRQNDRGNPIKLTKLITILFLITLRIRLIAWTKP